MSLLKFFLNLFLFTVFIFVVVQGFGLYLLSVKPNWPRDLFTQLIGAFILALFFFVIQYYRLRKMGIKQPTTEQLSVRQSSIISSELNFPQIEEKINVDKFFCRMKRTLDGTSIEIHSKLSWWSWGEKIKIEQLSTNGNTFEYKINSAPVLITTLMDSGRNLENVLGITHILQSKNEYFLEN